MIDGKSNKSTDNFLIAPTSIDGVQAQVGGALLPIRKV